ncbi:MAG: hypothetical protein ABIP53_01625 [Candidatus Limnocylindrales bacterium]
MPEADPPEPSAGAPSDAAGGAPGNAPSDAAGETSSDVSVGGPNYKGAPLDADRGPGLGCFWIQVGLLVFLLVATPVSVWLAFPPWVSAAFLILVLVLLFFIGQTSIFLLRLVAADRRSARRVPRSSEARKTVGMLEDEAASDASPSDQDDARAE